MELNTISNVIRVAVLGENQGKREEEERRRTVELADGRGGTLVRAGLPEAAAIEGSTAAASADCAASHRRWH